MGRKKLVAEWAASTLIVPPGHYRAGEPMVLLGFAVDWLRASWDAHEAAISTARKSGKSAIAAVLASATWSVPCGVLAGVGRLLLVEGSLPRAPHGENARAGRSRTVRRPQSTSTLGKLGSSSISVVPRGLQNGQMGTSTRSDMVYL